MDTIKYSFYLRKQIKDYTEQIVYLRLRTSGCMARFSTRIKLEPKYWNKKHSDARANWVLPSHPLHKVHNLTLFSLVQRINLITVDALTEQIHYTAKDYQRILEALDGKPIKQEKLKTQHPYEADFTAFMDYIIGLRKDSSSLSYYLQLKGVSTKMADFHGKTIEWADVTMPFMDRFQSYLQSTGIKGNTIQGVMKRANLLIKSAIEYGLLPDHNYLPKTKLSVKPIYKDTMPIDDFVTIANLVILPDSHLYHARNMFLFQFYAGGIRVSDVLCLRWAQVKDNKITLDAVKTGKRSVIPIIPKVSDILDIYRPKVADPAAFVFPYMTSMPDMSNKAGRDALTYALSMCTARYNKQLKGLAQMANLHIKLSSHMARHSFASFMATEGANMYQLMKVLGHSKLSTTEVYLRGIAEESEDPIWDKLRQKS